MKFALSLFGLGILFMNNWPRKKNEFIAVTPLVDSEELYLELKRSNPSLQYPVEEKIEIKEDICEVILKNGYFFDDQAVQPINPREKKIYEYIKTNHSITFEDLPGLISERDSFTSLATAKILNPYSFVEISVQEGIVHEHVFLCLAWNRKTRSIVDYFISQEYDLNVGGKGCGPRRRGRFVFTTDNMRQLKVVAVAEEPVRVEKWRSEESYYSASDNRAYTTDFLLKLVLEAQNPDICDLTTVQRIRLCSLVMNSKNYRKMVVKFLPYIDGVGPQCVQVNVTRRRAEPRFFFQFWDATFPEWAIECKAPMTSNKMYSLYISQGIKRNQFLVSWPEERKIILSDNFYTSI